VTGTPAERSAREELRRRQETMVRVVLRPVGSPLALGFVALAAATFVVSGLQLGWVEPTEGPNVALMLIAFVVPLQLLASVLGFLARDSLAGTAMGILAGTWAAVGLVLLTSPPGSTSDALGLFLLVAGTAMFLPATAAAASKLVPAMVLATTALRFLVTGVYQLTASSTWKTAAGLVGLLLAVVAMYAAWAFELEDATKKTVLPTLRRGKGAEALQRGLLDQVSEVDHEAGVRQQL
jgi:succinate-acetate transporter protein